MESKKCYSLNLATFCIKNGHVNYQIKKDNLGQVYIEFASDISEIKQMYREDENLHKYLNCFKSLKQEINKIKYSE